jgi:hypothetical protein
MTRAQPNHVQGLRVVGVMRFRFFSANPARQLFHAAGADRVLHCKMRGAALGMVGTESLLHLLAQGYAMRL